jgi:hypothetical protein
MSSTRNFSPCITMISVMVCMLQHFAARVRQKIILFFCLHSWGGVYTIRQLTVAPWWGYLSSYLYFSVPAHQQPGLGVCRVLLSSFAADCCIHCKA